MTAWTKERSDAAHEILRLHEEIMILKSHATEMAEWMVCCNDRNDGELCENVKRSGLKCSCCACEAYRDFASKYQGDGK